MIITKVIKISLFLSIISIVNLSAQDGDLYQIEDVGAKISGIWYNQLGSTLAIDSIDTSGKIYGYYISPSGTTGDKYPIQGWINCNKPVTGKDNGISISFSVHWGMYGSITSWTGIYKMNSGNSPKIITLWHLVRSNSNYKWDHTVTGSDTFHKK